MKRKLSSLLVVALLACAGCVMVPHTTIRGSIAGQPFSLSSPKDSKMEGLEITYATNTVSIKIQSVQAKMNPEVITTTADGQVKLIQAVGEEIRAGMAASAARAMGVPIK